MVKTIAVIRHYNRELDSEGRIVADLADYEAVYQLVDEIYIDSVSGAVTNVRALVEAVSQLDRERISGERITAARLGEYLGFNRMSALRRARRPLSILMP